MSDELSELLDDLEKAERLAEGHKPLKAHDGPSERPVAEALPIDGDEETVPAAEPIEACPSGPANDPVISGLMDDLRNIIASMGECRTILKGATKS
ncbi:MAG: hypothetical protein MUC62_10865 [Candidatus Thermoplasmatota archaeon]|jgi:hypothetical protein|nr:hypothetical protein [Candidatus Thermoplasmatota archaeon]